VVLWCTKGWDIEQDRALMRDGGVVDGVLVLVCGRGRGVGWLETLPDSEDAVV
jgi:delta 1-pyrroline-5-carboxylate dehydrogenase